MCTSQPRAPLQEFLRRSRGGSSMKRQREAQEPDTATEPAPHRCRTTAQQTPAGETQKKPEVEVQKKVAEETQKKPEVQPAEEEEPPPSQGSLSATTLPWSPPGDPWD